MEDNDPRTSGEIRMSQGTLQKSLSGESVYLKDFKIYRPIGDESHLCQAIGDQTILSHGGTYRATYASGLSPHHSNDDWKSMGTPVKLKVAVLRDSALGAQGADRNDDVQAQMSEEYKFLSGIRKEDRNKSRMYFPDPIAEVERGNYKLFVYNYEPGESIDNLNLSPALATYIMSDAIKAIGFLHSQGLLHTNLTPGHIVYPTTAQHIGTYARVVGTGNLQRYGKKEPGQPMDPKNIEGGKRNPLWQADDNPFMDPVVKEDPDAFVGPDMDLYALGVIFYQALTGQTVDRDSYEPPHFLNPGIHEGLDAVLQSLLNLTYDDSSAESISGRLKEVLEDSAV